MDRSCHGARAGGAGRGHAALIALLLVALTAAAGCGSGSGEQSGGAAAGGDRPGAKVGWVQSLVMTGVYEMPRHAEGAEIELTSFANGVDEVRALNTGQIDVAAVAYQQYIAGLAAGYDYVAVAGVARGGLELVANRDLLPAGQVGDDDAAYTGPQPWNLLKGRKVSTLPGTYPDMACRQYMSEHGIDPQRDVEFVNTPTFPEQIAAVARGDADVACGLDPFPIDGRVRGRVALLDFPYPRNGRFDYLQLSTVLVAKASTVRDKPQAVQAAVDALVASTAALEADKAKWIDAVTEYLPFPREIVALGVDPSASRSPEYWYNDFLDNKMYDVSTARWVPLMLRLGAIRGEQAALAREVVDRFDYSFLQRATRDSAARLGKGS